MRKLGCVNSKKGNYTRHEKGRLQGSYSLLPLFPLILVEINLNPNSFLLPALGLNTNNTEVDFSA